MKNRSIPTLGYPSRTAAVLDLRAKGLSTAEIARRIGIDSAVVSALELTTRRWRGRQTRPAESRAIVFPAEVLDRARPHAARRGISANELVRRLVVHAIDEDMVDAVLDDAHDLPPSASPLPAAGPRNEGPRTSSPQANRGEA